MEANNIFVGNEFFVSEDTTIVGGKEELDEGVREMKRVTQKDEVLEFGREAGV